MENILNNNTKFCCKPFEYSLVNEDDSGNIIYVPSTRVYAVSGNPPAVIKYCPFCGSKLPDELYDKRYEFIGKELGKEYLSDDDGNPPKKELPQEFQTDEWWKKRGL